jgi:hypothetical protein
LLARRRCGQSRLQHDLYGSVLLFLEYLVGIGPTEHGREKGQIDGKPEDGDSFFNVQR